MALNREDEAAQTCQFKKIQHQLQQGLSPYVLKMHLQELGKEEEPISTQRQQQQTKTIYTLTLKCLLFCLTTQVILKLKTIKPLILMSN